MRIVLPAALIVAALSFSAKPSNAVEGPWCAFIAIGTGAVYEDCQYWSLEQCRPNVIAGNRGFCNLNPRYAANWPGYAPVRKRHVQRY